ncbi:MAG: manganese efflux pump MntP family protein [Thermovirgaceae bacterium]|nr:manganese efflux pump MntP family protein [Thermovirgaceae bacterium]
MFGLSLSMDTLAISLAMVVCSSLPVTPASITRVAGIFGLFQAFMPMAGWGLAETAISVTGGVDHWIAFGLLALVGGRMIYEGLQNSAECIFANDPSRGLPLIILALGTSIDALAVGVSFVPLGAAPFFTSSVIGIVTFIIVASGMLLANRIGRRSGKRMEVLGGVILIAIGVKILFSHLAG